MFYILLMFKMDMISIPSAGVGGLCVSIFSSLQGWLCVGALCALQCAKNSVESGRQSHGCLSMCRMFNRRFQIFNATLVVRSPFPLGHL